MKTFWGFPGLTCIAHNPLGKVYREYNSPNYMFLRSTKGFGLNNEDTSMCGHSRIVPEKKIGWECTHKKPEQFVN